MNDEERLRRKQLESKIIELICFVLVYTAYIYMAITNSKK